VSRGRRVGAVLAVTAAVALAYPLVAGAKTIHPAARARSGILHAHKAGWIKASQGSRYRADVYLAARAEQVLPKLRGQALSSQLWQVATSWDSYIAPRALALFSQLRENVDYLQTHRIPADQTDVVGEDGVVYRWFAGKGLEFHPLANFARLNALVAQRKTDQVRQLADALLARAVPHKGALRWEYAFPYGIGRAPWTSGLAQAVAAQSLARASALLGDASLMSAARRAYLAVPRGLDLQLSTGPWVRLYSFDHEVVLNAQLQGILSLQSYAAAAHDPDAAALATRMLASARGLLGRFDTGDWSRYELGGGYAKRSYQEFVTELLGKLADATEDPFWQDAATRFVNYTYEPPEVTQDGPPDPPVAYPRPLDGWLDTVSIPITLSKKASLTLVVAGHVLTYSKQARGAHVLTWKPGPDVAPGTYPVTVHARDFEGRSASYPLEPVTIAWDTEPPEVAAQVDTATNTLTWSTTDAGTPWLKLGLQLTDPEGIQQPRTIDLGEQAPSGSLPLVVPAGTWDSALIATNSAGQQSTVYLPLLSGTPTEPPPTTTTPTEPTPTTPAPTTSAPTPTEPTPTVPAPTPTQP
jgi:cell division septation protein DedD